jgi:hypothetical protein
MRVSRVESDLEREHRLSFAIALRACAGAWLAVNIVACTGRIAPASNVAPAVLGAPRESAAADSQRTDPPVAVKKTGRFYSDKQYGSELQFNPLTVFVNEGWDMMRLVDDRAVFDQPYRASWNRLWKSVTSPGATVKQYGVSRWLRNEVFPLTFGGKGGQWEPNYHLHVFGAGMTYIRTAEWFEQHDVPHPRIASAITLFAGHVANEVLENFGHSGYNEDGMTDLLIFDPAGMLLWNTEWMQRTFSGRIEMTDWYGQPVLSQPGNRLENAFSMFMLRTPLPRAENWKFITTGGNAFLGGVSRRLGREHWLSVTAGAIPVAVPVIDSATNTRTVKLQPNIGIFVDRNGSLLASFVGRTGITNGATLNVYPGVIGSGRWSPGLFVQESLSGVDGRGLRFGITSSFGVGFGAVSRRQ